MSAAAALLLAAAAPFTCGAVERPGIAEQGPDGVWRGAAVDYCRKAAAGAPIRFHAYDSLSALRDAPRDRLAFLSDDERARTDLRAGPVIAVDRQILLTHAGDYEKPADLAGKTACFLIGTRAEAALNAWIGRQGIAIRRLAFQEPVEMADGFDVGKCAAVAVDAAEAPQRGKGGVTIEETEIRVAKSRKEK